MKIDQAKELKSGDIYSLEEINELYRNGKNVENLVCSYCGCPLSYYPAGIKNAYLKKRNGTTHSENCTYDDEIIIREPQSNSLGVIYYKMNAKDKRSRALDARKKFFQESTPKKERFGKRYDRKNNDSNKKNVTKVQLVRDSDLADDNVTSNMIKGKIRIPRKFVNEINANMSGKTINLLGFLRDIRFKDHQVVLIAEYENERIEVVLTESLFAKASVEYRDLWKIIKQDLSKRSNSIDIVVAGEVVVKDRMTYFSVYEEDDLYLEGQRTVQFVANFIQKVGV